MFLRAKCKIWIAVLAVCVTCSVLMRLIPQIKANQEEKKKNDISYTIQMDTKDQALNSRTANQTISFYNTNVTFINSKIDPDIIITGGETEEIYNTYEKMAGGLYTTFTLFTNRYLYKEYEGGWLNKSEEHGTTKYSKDIRILLEAIEAGKTWGEIGANGSCVVQADEPVELCVPTKYHYSYELLRQYIAVVLNNYEPLDEDNIKKFTTRADLILNKCKQVELSTFIDDSDVYGLLLAPESTIAECSKIFKNYTRGIIYPGKSIEMAYDVYVKPDKINNIIELSKSEGFWRLFGLRSSYGNNTGTKDSLFERCFGVVAVFPESDLKLPSEIQEPVNVPESNIFSDGSTTAEESITGETESTEKAGSEKDTQEQNESGESTEQETDSENNPSDFYAEWCLLIIIGVWFIILIIVGLIS